MSILTENYKLITFTVLLILSLCDGQPAAIAEHHFMTSIAQVNIKPHVYLYRPWG